MSLLISGVFGDEVEVFAANDKGSVHFGGDDGACKNTATDRDFASERAFLVCRERVRQIIHIVGTPPMSADG